MNGQNKSTYLVATLLIAVMMLLGTGGCDETDDTTPTVHEGISTGDQRGQLFETFANNLNQLEDFPPQQMLPQLRDFLSHWKRESKPEVNWKLDPLFESIPDKFRALPEVKRISATDFDAQDMEFLMECVWLRDIARRARGEGIDELMVASNLFDWTIRNLQIEPADSEKGAVQNQSLSEILLLGRATAMERAWVFIQLCRQQGLDAFMLAVADGDDKTRLRPWVPAVRIEDELYLFDPLLGLPIPGPDGRPVATLSEAAADDKLLRALDLDADHPYPWKASDVQQVVALVEASPGYLSRGMKLVESHLSGNERVVLSTSPSKSIVELKKLKHVGDAQLWMMPYEVLAARRTRSAEDQQNAFREMVVFIGNSPLYGGRVRQFKGDYNGEKGAKRHFLESRVVQNQVPLDRLPPEQQEVVQQLKQAASFWLGMIAYDEQDYIPAVDYFRERVLIASPDGPWTAGARYNLGRTYEALGEIEKAVAQYQLDKSPQSTGNRLRARRLLTNQSESKPAAAQ